MIRASLLLLIFMSGCSSKSSWSWELQPDGRWRHVRTVNCEWAEERCYESDRVTLVQRRYWDVYGRMIDVQYDEDGKPGKMTIRD